MGRLLALIAVSVSVVACTGDDSRTYRTEEVVEAFQRHGFVLMRLEGQRDTTAGALLRPTRGQPFVVMVASDREADEAWSAFESQQTYETFDARRANVVVSSDRGLRASDRRRVIAVLSSLPDRGATVSIAGRG